VTWKLNTLPEALGRQYAYRESLMRLGFEDDQIVLSYGHQMIDWPTSPGDVAVTVDLYVDKADKRATHPDFIITCGGIPHEHAQAETTDPSFNKLSPDERTQLYERWHPWPMMFHLAHAIVNKGITVPNIDDVRQVAALRGLPTLVPVRQDPKQGGN
jgi:hypothetical protein